MLATHRARSNPALLEVVPILLPTEVTAHIDRKARRDPGRMIAIAADWRLFLAESDALIELDDDGIEIEQFTCIYQRFHRLRDFGVNFAPSFVAWMDGLRAEIHCTGDDPDHDQDWADFEAEDPDEDYEDRNLTDDMPYDGVMHDPTCCEAGISSICEF